MVAITYNDTDVADGWERQGDDDPLGDACWRKPPAPGIDKVGQAMSH